MRHILTLTLVFIIHSTGQGQQQKIDSITFQINTLEEEKKEIELQIIKLKKILSVLITVEPTASTDQFIIATCIASPCRLIPRAIDLGPSEDDIIVPKGEVVQLNYDTQHYQNFFPAIYNGKQGYIYKNSFSIPKKKIDDSNDPLYNTSIKKSRAAASRSSAVIATPSRNIQTGPRGGRYYINKNGKKTYVKKK